MLQKEKFQLFSEVYADSVVGVVKSQTNSELVYACRLASNGHYYCCTQNLKACGGLKGAPCKHLILLIVGLTRAKSIEPMHSARWMISTLCEKPTVEKTLISDVFLKYKGVEAGEVDWRPNETIPEDYYAF